MSEEKLIQDSMVELHDTPQEKAPEPEKQPQPDAKQEETRKEYNMRVLREKNDASEKRIRELEEAMQWQAQQPRQQQQQNNEEDELFDFNDDDLIEGRQLKKIINRVEKKLGERQQNTAHQLQQQQAEQRLRSMYSDIDKVVTEDNIKTFATIYPEEYATVMSNPDMYAKGKTIYTLMKNLGINQNDQYEDIDNRLQENKSRPRAAATAGGQTSETPLARVGEYDRRVLTEERKAQLRQQVADAKARG